MATIRLERKGDVAHLVLDNPSSRNGMTLEMTRAGCEHLAAIEADRGIRAVVVRGEGGWFCSGADLRASAQLRTMSDAEIESAILEMHLLIEKVATCSRPTLARIDGACAGFGLSLALACDLRAAAADTKLTLAFTRIGLHPDGGMSWLLPRVVGYARALEMLLLPEPFDGERAAAMGLVHRAVPPGELDALAEGWAARLAAGPPIALRLARENFRLGAEGTLRAVLDREARTQAQCIHSDDAIRGIEAFFARREPRFEGT